MAEEKVQKKVADDVDSESDDLQSDEDGEEEVGGDSDKMEWGKKVEPELRRWIETEDCRRDVADQYFDNPPLRQGQKLLHFKKYYIRCAYRYLFDSPHSHLLQ